MLLKILRLFRYFCQSSSIQLRLKEKKIKKPCKCIKSHTYVFHFLYLSRFCKKSLCLNSLYLNTLYNYFSKKTLVLEIFWKIKKLPGFYQNVATTFLFSTHAQNYIFVKLYQGLFTYKKSRRQDYIYWGWSLFIA